jgi:membrane-associated phospholipid phosphatase
MPEEYLTADALPGSHRGKTYVMSQLASLPGFVRQRLDPAQRYGLRLTLFALVIVLVFVPFGFLLEQVVDEGRFTTYDRAVAEQLHDIVLDHPASVGPLQFISFLGKPIWFYILVGAVCIYLWLHRRIRLILYLVATGFVGGAIDTAVKVLVSRPRPRLDDPVATAFGQSFPSGHAFTSTAIYGALLLCFLPVISRRWRSWAVAGYAVLVLAIAFSRLALGVHFVTDVVGGIVLGGAWLVASTAAFEIWRVERGRKATTPLKEGVEPEAARELKRSVR